MAEEREVRQETDDAEALRPATAADVARRAGVSEMTVSRVANGKLIVSQTTRQRVEAAIVELGYVPNRAAQFLASKRQLRRNNAPK